MSTAAAVNGHVAAFAPTIEQATEWIRVLVDREGAVEVRSFGSNRKPQGPALVFGPRADPRRIAARALALSRSCTGVYVTLNRLRADLVGYASDGDVIRRVRLLIDIDPTRPADTNATDAEKAAARAVAEAIRAELRRRGWPEPIFADSGNGYHLVYAIDLPNDGRSTAIVKGCLAALARRFNAAAARVDTAVSNASRISKVYGTVPRKGEATPDRPHRPAVVIEAPDRLDPVPVGLLEALAAEAEPADPAPAPGPGPGGGGVDGQAGPWRATATGPDDGIRKWFRRRLDGLAGNVVTALPGDRHKTLLANARTLGGYLVGECTPYFPDESEVVRVLTAAATGCNLPADEIAKTIRDGLAYGKWSPCPWPDVLDRPGGKAGAGPGGGGDGDDEREDPILDRWPLMDAAAFHGIAGEIVRTIDPHTESDPVATLLQFVVGFGNLVGRKPHFVVGATRHYPALNAALVGPTAGGRKGSSWDCTRHVLQGLDEAWARDRVKGGLVSGEGLIYHVRDPATRRVALRDKRTGKVEGYEDVEDDPGVADKRLLAVETELGRMLKAMNREANTLSDVARQAWDCMPVLGTLAKNSPNRASNAHVSIIGHITQADIRKHLSGTDSANGFGNRFLWVCVRRSKELPDGGNFYAINWAPVVDRLGTCLDAARRAGVIARDQDAAKLWREIYGELSAGKPGLLGAILGRAEPQVMRLALIYALLDASGLIRVEHLTAALAVWKYCEDSCRLIFGDSLGDADAEKLLDALRAAPDGLARTEITVQVFGRHKKSAEIASLLSRLLDLGLIHRLTVPSLGKKPAERWYAGRGAYRAANLIPPTANFAN